LDFLTAESQLTEESGLCSIDTGLAAYPGLKKLMVALSTLKQRLIAYRSRTRECPGG